MADYEKLCGLWLEKATADPALRGELLAVRGDAAALEDRFYRELEFGTGGLRGVMGAGTNRMNVCVVARATQGCCRYLAGRGDGLSAAVAYDSRLKSRLFAETAAGVFAANGIRVYFYPRLMPTPTLSFAVRHLGCALGVMITASHNAAPYNGYKVYGPDGCQITERAAAAIAAGIRDTDIFSGVRSLPFAEAVERGLVTFVGEDVVDAYFAAVDAASLYGGGRRDMPVVYTPLNGAGISCVPRCLREHGFTDVFIPPEQERPDGNFPTCPNPNPERREALETALRAAEARGAELVLATDPDCDRVGVAVRTEGGYRLLSGNQTGALLLDFVCRRRLTAGTMPERPVAVKTIVTTPLAERIAAHYGVELRETLTGFKYIGEAIGALEAEGEAKRFLFGFEESYGYLSTAAVRDKDAVNASLLIGEMFVWYREKGRTLADALEELYRVYGYYEEKLLTFTYEGSAGLARMRAMTAALRAAPPRALADLTVESATDYRLPGTGLPAADVLQYRLAGGTLATVRPSGTEPKLKVYLAAAGRERESCEAALAALTAYFTDWSRR